MAGRGHKSQSKMIRQMATERIIREQSQKKIEKPAKPGKALALAAALLILPSIAHAQGWLNGLGAFSNGYARGQYESQDLESLRLQNEMLRLQRQRLMYEMYRDNRPRFAPPRAGYIPND